MNFHDSFPRQKFKNRAPTNYSPGPILWPPIISFELHAKMAEEIDVEKCTFRNFGSSVTLTLTLEIRSRSHWCAYVVYPHTKLDGNQKNFFVDVPTDGRTHLSSNLLGHRRGDDLKIQCCLGGDFNQRYLLYKIAQIIALSTVYHLLQCLDEYETYSQSHIFALWFLLSYAFIFVVSVYFTLTHSFS